MFGVKGNPFVLEEGTKVQTPDGRWAYPVANPDGSAISDPSLQTVEILSNDYSSVNVTTSAYVELIASTYITSAPAISL